MTLVNMVPLWARGHYNELIDKLQRYASDILHASIVWVNGLLALPFSQLLKNIPATYQ